MGNADIQPEKDMNDYETQQGLAIDPNQVDPESRVNLAPTAQGEMHQGGSGIEVIGGQDAITDPYYASKKNSGLI